MRIGSLILALLLATGVWGQQQNFPGSAGSSSSTAGGPNYILASNYGVVGNGKACFDGTVTSASPNISSAGQCTWTSADIGSYIFVTNNCSAGQCGFINGTTSQTILPSTQITIARIATITDSHHIIVDCNAPADCVSPNASATNTGHATILYAPTKQATQINAAWNAGFANLTSGCPTIVYPQGIIFFESQIWTPLPAGNSCSAPSGFNSIQQSLTLQGGGPIISGVGYDATVFVPVPDFNFTCNNNVCIGPLAASNNIVTYEHFAISGFGQSMYLSGISESGLVACNACVMDHVILSGWMNRVTGSAGVFNNAVGFSSIHHSMIMNFGGQSGCLLVTGDNNFLEDSVLGFCGGPVMTGTGGAGSLTSTGNSFYIGNTNNSPQIDTSGWVNWQSVNDRFFYSAGVNTAPSDDIKIVNGSTASIVNFFDNSTGVNFKGIHVLSGGKLYLSNYVATGAKANGLTVDSGGIFVDGGGNTPNYASSTNSCAGSCYGDVSMTGTALVVGNLSPSANWGTGAAFTVPTGNARNFTFTLTNGSASVGASPTITLTFPGGPFAFPFARCSLWQVGGTQAITAVTEFLPSSSLTATSVVFTYGGTPTANLTEFYQG